MQQAATGGAAAYDSNQAAAMADGNNLDGQHQAHGTDQEAAMLSMEITNCFKLALSPEAKLGTGCPSLNEFLRGGLLPKRLYEIYGEAGTGKTNLAIQLLLNVRNNLPTW